MECLSHYSEKEGLSAEDRDVINIGRLCSEQLLSVINDVLDYSKVSFPKIFLMSRDLIVVD